MSYILEALRRSQAERERGRVPGLDAQPLAVDPASSPRRGLPIVWVSSGLGVVLLLIALLIATWWLRPQARGPQAVAEGRVDAAAPQPPRATAPAPRPAPPPAPLPTLPQVVSVPPPAAQPARPAAAPVPGTNAAPALPPAAAASNPSPPAAPAAPRVLTLAQLNAEQRRELPAMAVGGSIWSDNAANRFVIINGQVIREGETAAPGVTLERIAPKAATLRWRDLRIELPL
jgi:general secretion pathway protein B